MISPEQKPIIEIHNLGVILGNTFILKNLDLNIFKNEITAIVGGSGSGKTTLLRTILMLLPFIEGSITIFGKNIAKCNAETEKIIQRSWGVMFQHSALFSSLTVLENVKFPLREQTGLDKKTVTEIAKLKLSLVGLSSNASDKYPSELSGGMQKRAALARAIALDPQLLFLDEPTAGLDPQGASSLDELVLNLKENLGLTIIMITHDLDTLWRVTDRVAFLGEGKVLQVDNMTKLTESQNTIIKKYFEDPRSKAARHIREEI